MAGGNPAPKGRNRSGMDSDVKGSVPESRTRYEETEPGNGRQQEFRDPFTSLPSGGSRAWDATPAA